MTPTIPSPISKPDVSERVIVFLVDDQDLEADLVRAALRHEADIEVHHCSQGENAVAMALEIKPTVILQDSTLR